MKESISRRETAQKVIRNMHVGNWETLANLARKARHNHGWLTNREMACYLKQHGNLERMPTRIQMPSGRWVVTSKWRKTKDVTQKQ